MTTSDTDKKQKELKALNKVILKGKEKYSLQMSLALTAGFGIGLTFAKGFPGFLEFLLLKAWLFFFFSFLITYFFSWNRKYKKASRLIEEIGEGELVTPPSTSIISIVSFGIIFIVLALPTLFKDRLIEIAKQNQQQTSGDNSPQYYHKR